MSAGSGNDPDAERAAIGALGEPVSGRLGSGRSRATLGGLGILGATLLIAALVAWPSLTGTPQPSPTSAASIGVGSSAGTPTAPNATQDGEPTPVDSGPTVVDRPGVPADLYDRYWFTDWGAAGSVGTTAHYELPDNERFLDVADGFIASMKWVGDDRSQSEVTIRRFDTGVVTRMIDVDSRVLRGTIVDGTLFWTGVLASGGTGPSLDGGVWALDLTATTSPVAVVQPGGDMSLFAEDGRAERTPFNVSPTGRTLSSTIGGALGARTDIIDIDDLILRGTLDAIVVEVSDTIAITYDDGPPKRVGAVSIDSGTPLWRYPSADDEADVVSYTNAVILEADLALSFQGRRGGEDVQLLVLVDLETGQSRELLGLGPEMQWLYLIPRLSTPSHLGLASESILQEALDEHGFASISIIDPDAGTLTRDAFRIELP